MKNRAQDYLFHLDVIIYPQGKSYPPDAIIEMLYYNSCMNDC